MWVNANVLVVILFTILALSSGQDTVGGTVESDINIISGSSSESCHFFPNNITASNGTTVNFLFSQLSEGVAVIQSGFDNPCLPLAGGFNATDSFNLTIIDDRAPVWFYCTQIRTIPQCGASMVGVINAPMMGSTFANFQALAASNAGVFNESASPSTISLKLPTLKVNKLDTNSPSSSSAGDTGGSLPSKTISDINPPKLPTNIDTFTDVPPATTGSPRIGSLESIINGIEDNLDPSTTSFHSGQSTITPRSSIVEPRQSIITTRQVTIISPYPSTVTWSVIETLFSTFIPSSMTNAASHRTLTRPMAVGISLAISLSIVAVFGGFWCVRRSSQRMNRMDASEAITRPHSFHISTYDMETQRVTAFIASEKRNKHHGTLEADPSVGIRSNQRRAVIASTGDPESIPAPARPEVPYSFQEERNHVGQSSQSISDLPPVYSVIDGR